MARIKRCRSDQSRLILLKTIFQLEEALRKGRLSFLSDVSLNRVHQTYESLADLEDAASDDLGSRQELVRDHERAMARLLTHVRSFRRVVRARADLEDKNAYLRCFLATGKSFPQPTKYREWKGLAGLLLTGEKRALAKGYEPMRFPTAAALQEALTTIKLISHELDQTDMKHADSEKELRAQRKVADKVIRTLATQLRLALEDYPPSRQRRMMRRYGFRFEVTKKDERTARPRSLRKVVATDDSPMARLPIDGERLKAVIGRVYTVKK